MATSHILIFWLCALPLFVACTGSNTLVPPDSTASGSIIGRVSNPLQQYEVHNINVFTIPSSRTTSTDSSGSFRIVDVPPGDYTLYARSYNERAIASANARVSVHPGDATTADLVVSSSTANVGAVKGVVLDERSQPVSGAAIRSMPGEREYLSGIDGTFIIPDVSAGVYRISATKDSTSGEVQADVQERQLSTVEIMLRPIDTVNATVIGNVRESTLPLEGVEVRIVSLGIVDTTDANGTYRIPSIPEGNYYVRFQKEGYRMRNVPLKISRPGQSRIDALMVKGTDIPERGLELYARLNGRTDDGSPRDREMKMLGGEYTTDRFGNPTGALSCNGSGGVEVLDTLGLNVLPITLGAWIYVPRGPDVDQLILGKSNHPSGDGYYFYASKNKITCIYTLNFNVYASVSFGNYPRDTWFYVAFTLDSAGRGFGVFNGVNQTETLGPWPPVRPTQTTGALRIGSVQTTTTMAGFTGRIDHVILYNRAMTIDEIRDAMEQGD